MIHRYNVQVIYRGEIYQKSIDFYPSDLLNKTPSALIARMTHADGQDLKEFKLKACRKQQNQENYLINQCVGEIGEEIAAEFLKTFSWQIDRATPLGDFFAINPSGKKFLVEIKTSRDEERASFFYRQVRNMANYCRAHGIKPLFYLVYLKLIEKKQLTNFAVYDPDTTRYIFKVLRIKSFNKRALIMTNKKVKRPSIPIQEILKTNTPQKKIHYPAYIA